MDAADHRIVELLHEDARRPLKTIAGEVGLARSTVRERIAKLEAAGVILGYRADVRLGGDASPAAILDVQTGGESERLLRTLRAMPEVRRCYAMAELGRLLVEIVSDDVADLYRIGDWIAQRPEVDALRVSIIRNREIS